MSAKDEILVIEQTISEIDKKLFEYRSKLTQVLKLIPKSEEALAAVKIKVTFSKNTLKHMKTKTTDLVDILEFKQTTIALADQLDTQAETIAELMNLKKHRELLANGIADMEAARELKRLELNEYGKIETFAPKKTAKVAAVKGGSVGKAT